MLIALLPTALLGWLLADPTRNQPWLVPVEHFVVTSNVSVVAAIVALAVARAALGVGHYRTLLIALGFACLAAIFAVHGLSTPGVLQRGDRAAPAGLVLGVLAQLALLVAAIFFAARYTPLASWLERHVAPRALVIATAAALYDPSTYGYGPASSGEPTGGAGWLPFAVVAASIVLYLVAAFAQGRDFFRTGLPLQGALGIAYVLLAQAQVSQFLGPAWTPSWWEYHGLMLAAVVLALGALFLELDRRRGLERFLPATVVERVIGGDPLRL